MAALRRRQIDPPSLLIGVELDEKAADEASKHFHNVIVGPVEKAAFETFIPKGSLDLVLCLDVLEHLVDPWTVVKRVTPLISPSGRLIISVPNIRNWKFITRLALKGDFRYTDAGLLDRAHLRFFVRDTAVKLATCGGLKLEGCWDARDYTRFEFRNILNRITLGATKELLAKQWIVVASQGPA